MSLPVENIKYPSIASLKIDDDMLTANMSDGRIISIPVAWFPTLAKASEKDLRTFEISPSGYGIHWENLDEDISVKAFFE